MDTKEFKRRVTEHFENVTEEEFLKNLQKSAPDLFHEELGEPGEVHPIVKVSIENDIHTKHDSQNLTAII